MGRRPVATGPHLRTILLGLLLLAAGVAVVATQVADEPIDWSRVGPYAVLSAGALLALAGALAALTRRRR
jgi:membrane associated rhomboid family serine protease